MSLFIEWALNPYNTGSCVFMKDGRVTFNLSHPNDRKQSFVVYKNPCIVIYLGVVALVTGYRKHYGLTIEESLSHGLLHELSHALSGISFCGAWNEFLAEIISNTDKEKD